MSHLEPLTRLTLQNFAVAQTILKKKFSHKVYMYSELRRKILASRVGVPPGRAK